MKILFSLILLLTPITTLAHPTSDELWNKVYLIHVTNFLRNGVVRAGQQFSVHDDRIDGLPEEVRKLVAQRLPFHLMYQDGLTTYIDTGNYFPRARPTTHWTAHEPVGELNAAEKAMHALVGADKGVTWTDRKIAILEPAIHFKGQLLGGRHTDFYVIGDHRLSKDAVVMAPKEMLAELKRLNPHLTRWIAYPKALNAQQAVHRFNANDKLREQYFPQFMRLENPKDRNLVTNDGWEHVLYKGQRILANLLFGAWILDDQIYWDNARTSTVGTLEDVLTKLHQPQRDYLYKKSVTLAFMQTFQTARRGNGDKLLTRKDEADLQKAAESLKCTHSRLEMATGIKEVDRLTKKFVDETRHLSPYAREYIAQFLDDVDLWLFSLRGFCNYFDN